VQDSATCCGAGRAFARFLADGNVCFTNNAAERALRCVPLGREAWLFCGSDRGGQRAAILYTLIQTARLNGVDPQVACQRPRPHRRSSASKLDDLLPWKRAPHSVNQRAMLTPFEG